MNRIPMVRSCPTLRGVTGRRGLASVLAMLYLVLFSTLAVGFYAATAINVQIAKNERALSLAESAADGGMQFIRYQLGLLAVPSTVTQDQYLNTAATNLAGQMNTTTNMGGNTVQIVGTAPNATIYIPSATGWIPLDSKVGTQFRAKIQQVGSNLIVTVDGAGPDSTLMRAIQLSYQFSQKAGAILNYGVASNGTVTTGGATKILGLTSNPKGSVLSADVNNSTPINIGGKEVSGDLSIVQPAGNVVFGGAMIGMSTDPVDIAKNHIHKGVTPPTFPTVDTSMFIAFTKNSPAYVAGQSSYTNQVIPPNTNPKFTSGTQINGVLYVQAPNNVTFRGGVTITGVIVTDPAGKYDPVNNTLNFAGNVTAQPVSSLSTATYGNLPNLTGSFILAPNFFVSMTGDFGTVSGSIVAGQVSMSGNSGGTVQGSVIAMVDNATGASPSVYLNGSAEIDIASTGTSNFPTGLSFGNNFTPALGTYAEVTPWQN